MFLNTSVRELLERDRTFFAREMRVEEDQNMETRIHVYGAPVVEIHGVLERRLEIWWKPYYDRGTSAS